LGFYELLGVDIIIDENFKPYLLEVNTNPALFLDTLG
jgi:tubulin--tyrosine ligase like protein 10